MVFYHLFVYKLHILIEDLENVIKHMEKNYSAIITHHHERHRC